MMDILEILVWRRNKKYIGDLSDPVQMFMYWNNITNLAVDKKEQEMREQGSFR